MRVMVLESRLLGPCQSEVRITSPFGQAVVLWASEGPAGLGDYDVEFNVADRVDWARTAVAGPRELPSIGTTVDGLRLCGEVESVQDDGVVALRLGPSLILLETIGVPPAIGSSVCVTVRDVELHPHED